MGLATRQPAEDLKAEGSCDTVLVQSVLVPEQLQGFNSVSPVGDPCMAALVVECKVAELLCLTCPTQRTCRHVKAIQGDTATEAASLEDREEAWLRNFGFVSGRSTAQRHVTSISQVRS